MKKILIIGSEGFIGAHCTKFFLNKGWAVYGIDLKDYPKAKYRYYKELSTTTNFDRYFKEINPDVCIYASGSASVGHSMQFPVSDLEANAVQVFRLLESIRVTAPACRFINLSSAAVYGNPKHLPVAEADEIRPMSPYGWHKYYSELACKEYNQIYNISTCSLRPFSVYGPGQTKLLLWDICTKMQASKEQIELFGTGQESRDFIYIHDLVNILFLLIEKAEMKGEAYNIASGSETTIKQVAEEMLANFNYPGQLIFNLKTKEGDPTNWRADISRIKALGFSASVDIRQGIKSYCDWIRDNHLYE